MILKIVLSIITYAVCRESGHGRESRDISTLQSDTKNSPTECPVPELNNFCAEQCEAIHLDCLFHCDNDLICVSECTRQMTYCIQDCPCNDGCPDGCDECDHPICQCQDVETNFDWNMCIDDNGAVLGRCVHACNGAKECETECLRTFKVRQSNCPCEENCKGGCPCENFTCMDTSTTSPVTNPTMPSTTVAPTEPAAVLALNNFSNKYKPMVIGFDGKVNDDIDFTYGEETATYYGCGATLRGEFWYFGGYNGPVNTLRQASKIEGCKLERKEDLPFDFYLGACNTFLQQKPHVLLCFDYNHDKSCYTFDGEQYQSIADSIVSHRQTFGLANYKDQALTVGCSRNEDADFNGEEKCSFKTEILDMSTLTWTDRPKNRHHGSNEKYPNYPFRSTRISQYSTASSPEAAYIIGGYFTRDIVAEFKDDRWRRLHDLFQGRTEHSSLTVGSQTIIIGGIAEYSPVKTEIWKFETGNSKTIDPATTGGSFIYGIGIYAVDLDFCRKNY